MYLLKTMNVSYGTRTGGKAVHKSVIDCFRWMDRVKEILCKGHSDQNESFMRRFREYNLEEELKYLK